jgi:hypothetical protein
VTRFHVRCACALLFAGAATISAPAVASNEPSGGCSEKPATFEADKPLRFMMHVTSRGLHGDPAAPVGMYSNPSPPPGVSPGGNAAAAIIAALVIGGINESQRRSMLQTRAQVKEMLSRRDIEGEWREKALKAATAHAWFAKSQVEHVSDPLDLEQPGMLVRITESTIMTMDTRLLLQTDLVRVHASSSVYVWRRQDHVPLYCRHIIVVSEAASPEGASQHWLANDGERLSQFVADATDQTMRVVALDAGALGKASATGNVSVTLNDLRTGKPMPVVLSLIEDDDQRLVGRTKLHNQDVVVSIPKWGANERAVR